MPSSNGIWPESALFSYRLLVGIHAYHASCFNMIQNLAIDKHFCKSNA